MKRIGITNSHFQWPEDPKDQARLTHYVAALEDAGAAGELLWLPRAAETRDEAALADEATRLAAQLDGLLLSGGADLPPELYSEAPRPDANLDLVTPARPLFEAALVQAFLERGKPVLGICYGCQFLNVWRGGSLVQDIPTQWPRAIEHRDGATHSVRLTPGSLLARIIGARECEVKSYHHQGVARVAENGFVSAVAPDRVSESVEFSAAPLLLGVQWHPERDRASDATQRLFAALVK